MKTLRKSLLALAMAGALAPLPALMPTARAQSTVSSSRALTFTVVLVDEAVSATALAAVEAAGGTVVGRLDSLGVLEVTTPAPAAFLRALVGHPEVASVGPSLRVSPEQVKTAPAPTPTASPSPANDPAAYLWNIERVTRGGAAWAVHSGTHDVVVGILDSGLDLAHPDLVANIAPGSRSFVPGMSAWDDHGHGTHVAGTIAARGRIRGVAPGVGIRSYRIFGPQPTSVFTIAQAIRAAADDGCDVINLSFGFMQVRGQVYFVDPASGERISLGNDVADLVLLQRAVRYAVNHNAVVVSGSGNDGIDLTNRHAVAGWFNGWLQAQGVPVEVRGAAVHVPGSLPGALTISAAGGGWGSADRLAGYSSYGNGVVDLTAPGGDLGPTGPAVLEPDFYKYLVLSTRPTYLPCGPFEAHLGLCGYGFAAGVSMAIPSVSGAAALVISEEYARTGRKPSPAQVVVRLQHAAEDVGKTGHDAQSGHGMVDALRALTLH
jgi:subtilisin family serine protease